MLLLKSSQTEIRGENMIQQDLPLYKLIGVSQITRTTILYDQVHASDRMLAVVAYTLVTIQTIIIIMEQERHIMTVLVMMGLMPGYKLR